MDEQKSAGVGSDKYNCWGFAFRFLNQEEYNGIDFLDPNYNPLSDKWTYRYDSNGEADLSTITRPRGISTIERIFGIDPAVTPRGIPPVERKKFDLVVFYFSSRSEGYVDFINSPVGKVSGGDWMRYHHFAININLKTKSGK